MRQDILVVDDDAAIREVIRFALEDAGMAVREAGDGAAALREIVRRAPDLVVLDIGMPQMDGFETCKAIRKTSAVPIVFLTARSDEIDRVLAFELGGDDHVAKPFSPRELVLRIRAILKRREPPEAAEEQLRHADLLMVPGRHLCELGSRAMVLTGIEYALLATLMRAPEQVRSRGQLIDAVWGHNSQLSDRTLDSHLRNIRAKAAALGCAEVVETVHGVGVRLGACRL